MTNFKPFYNDFQNSSENPHAREIDNAIHTVLDKMVKEYGYSHLDLSSYAFESVGMWLSVSKLSWAIEKNRKFRQNQIS